MRCVRSAREEFARDKESLDAFKKTDLDPKVYNPLAKDQPVSNQQNIGQPVALPGKSGANERPD